MKIKEYPISIYSSLQLLMLTANRLTMSEKHEVPILVSLTSIPSRLSILHLTIRSLLNQTVKPENIILWLNKNLQSSIPKSLSKLENDVFKIRYENETCSHRKLVHALRHYPNKIIVTCDDDLIYHSHWLERLYKEHELNPKDIIGNECRRILYDSFNKVLPYRSWHSEPPKSCTKNTLAIGYAGTLYPPNSMHADVLRQDLYMALAPKADDLWFKAMSLKAGIKTRRSGLLAPKPIPIIRSQQEALGKTNIKQDGNRSQWQALIDYYPELIDS